MTLRTNDTFTDVDTTLISLHTGETGATWAFGTGFSSNEPRISNANRLRAGGSGGTVVFASGVATADGEVTEATVETLTTAVSFGIFARGHINLGGVARGYLAIYTTTGGVWKILRLDNSTTFTQVGSNATQALSVASHTVKLTVSGTGATVTILLEVDGATVINTTDTTGSRITTFGRAGVYFDTTNSNTAGTHIDSITYNDGVGGSTVTGVTVSPSTATVAGGATQTFTATVAGTGGPSQSVTWTTTAGSITSGGVLTAPAATGSVQTVTVTATSVQDGAFSGTATVTVPVATTYDVTTPADGRIYPLSGVTTGTASFTFSGTYSGTAPDQWRLVNDGTSTPVTGLDWASFGTAPASGTFSQSVTAVPKGGWYNVQVRNSADTGNVEVSGKVGAGVLVVVDGQSNAWLWFSPTAYAGDSTLTPNALLRVAGKQASVANSAWDVPATTTMNAAIACGNALVTALSCPVGLIDGSFDGSGLTVSGNGGQWISGGAAGNAYTSSAAAVTALVPSAIANVWIQGEADAGNSVTQSNYYTALGQLFSLRRTALSQSSLPYIMVGLARDLTGTQTDTQRENIKLAQVQKCADANVYRVDRMDLPLHTDNVHHTATGFTTLGQRVARAILAAVGSVSTYRGPRIASVAQTSTLSVFDVTLTHDMGTDFTPSSGITGFRVTDAGTPATISSVVRQSANVARITLSATPSVMPVVQYLYGTNPTVTSALKDNGSLTLPLEYNSGVTASAYVAKRCTLTLTTNGTTPAASVTGISWAWYDAAPPTLSSLPAVTGTGASTDASGVFDVAIAATTLSTGQTGTLLAIKSDGTAGSTANSAFCAPVVVS